MAGRKPAGEHEPRRGRINPLLHPGKRESRLAGVAIVILGNSAGSIAGLVALGGTAAAVLIPAVLVVAAGALWLQWQTYAAERAVRFYRHEDSYEYMCEQWAKGEHTLIATVDMSPAEQSEQVRAVLLEKARRGELTLCLPTARRGKSIVRELEDAGAAVHCYPTERPPKVRFSLLQWQSGDEELLVGRWDNRCFEIRRFPAGASTQFLAHDYAKLLSGAEVEAQ